jgi:hypothetical protein
MFCLHACRRSFDPEHYRIVLFALEITALFPFVEQRGYLSPQGLSPFLQSPLFWSTPGSSSSIRRLLLQLRVYLYSGSRFFDPKHITLSFSSNNTGVFSQLHFSRCACSRFFDPEHYQIVLFDQRGCGKSTPRGCLEENNTWELVEDLEKLRKELNIEK